MSRKISKISVIAVISAVALIVVGVMVAMAYRNQPAGESGIDSEGVWRGALLDRGEVPRSSKFDWEGVDDPGSDGWPSEAFSARAKKVLSRISGWIESGEFSDQDLGETIGDEFESSLLAPERKEVFRRGNLRVLRSSQPDPSRTLRGRAGWRESIQSVRGDNADCSLRCSLKIISVQKTTSGWQTRQIYNLALRCEKELREQTATWVIRWQDGENEPKLLDLRVEKFEEVVFESPRPLFSDCTASVFKGCDSYSGQILHGYDEWLGKIQEHRYFALLGTPGIALGDVNGDGLDDLYLCQEEGLPNGLYLQKADGSLLEISSRSGVDLIESSRSALLVDLDGDGLRDLAVAILAQIVIARGDGKGRFEIVASLPTSRDTMSLSAVDYDGDADLDLYVCAYKPDDLADKSGSLGIVAAGRFVYHDSNGGANNVLFENRGGWTFRDVTEARGLDQNNRRYSFAASWEDFDLDGDLDLYVANDFGRNCLYRHDTANGEHRFVDVAASLAAEDSASGMSVSWGDVDRDGRPDLYVGNMFSAAGGRIVPQKEFKPGASGEVRGRIQRFARGNTLLRGTSEGFEDVSVEAGVTMGRWAWGSTFVDINSDGWEDLVVANGYISTEDSGDL